MRFAPFLMTGCGKFSSFTQGWLVRQKTGGVTKRAPLFSREILMMTLDLPFFIRPSPFACGVYENTGGGGQKYPGNFKVTQRFFFLTLLPFFLGSSIEIFSVTSSAILCESKHRVETQFAILVSFDVP